jgi:hypothetical protein
MGRKDMRKKVDKWCFADLDKKVGDIVNDQLGQTFRVIAVSEKDITLEQVDV